MKISSNWKNLLKVLFTISFSSVITFLILELSYRIYLKNYKKNNYSGTILYQYGKNFVNHKNYFKYFANQTIRTMGVYSKSQSESIEDLVIEYDYLINTNNAGLVMRRDLNVGEKVALIIGDSFTEGQGSLPWFYQLEDKHNNSYINIVNMGIIGTGPAQWENLANSIIKDFNLKVVASVINIIPHDMGRKVWKFGNQDQRCLYKMDCDYNYKIQGYNFNNTHDYDDIKLDILKNLKENKFLYSNDNVKNIENNFIITLKNYLKKSYVISDINNFLVNKFGSKKSRLVIMNEKALIAMRDLVDGNFIVNLVSQKINNNSKKTINSKNFNNFKNARQLVKFLEFNDIEYVWCDIPSDKFKKYDFHPNSKGYKILMKCTNDALAKVID